MSTKATIVQQHDQNALLNAAAPPLMMRAAGDWGADEGAFPVDERVIERAAAALESGQTHYVDVPGIAPLREQIAADLNAAHGTRCQKGNVIVTAGVQESRFLTIQMIGEHYEQIAMPAVVHPGALKALGVRPMPLIRIPVDPAHGDLPSPDAIRAVLESGIRLIYLESPSRLSGRAYSADEARAISDQIAAHDAALIVDQGLAAWTPNYAALITPPEMDARAAAIGEAYSGMGLASWFIGYIAAPEAWIASMQSQKQIMAICTSTASQYAALEAGSLYADAHPLYVARLSETRAAVTAGLKPESIIAGDAVNTAAVRLAPDEKARVLAALGAAGGMVADGADFGAPDAIRITLPLDQNAAAAIRRALA
jgi:aspartate/methionine/tyrosine aminotransferase